MSHDDEFPVLTVLPTAKKMETGGKKVVEKRQPEEDFPVYNFKEKYVTPKPAKIHET